MEKKWAVIINPKSGKRQFKPQIEYLLATLKNAGIRFEYRFTGHVGHAQAIADEFTGKNYRNFLVVGGDGTFSEVVNGIFASGRQDYSNFKLALIPRGTGNDWGRFWGLTRDYKHSIEVFLKGKTRIIDVGNMKYSTSEGQRTHHFINSVGLGLDAKVVEVAHHIKKVLGSHGFIYSLGLFVTVFIYRAVKMKVFSGSKEMKEPIFTASIANGCYSGGGLKQTPDALPYDGELDCMFALKPKIQDIFTAITALFRGNLMRHRIIRSFRTQDIRIQSREAFPIEADGIGLPASTELNIGIIPAAIQMVVPEKFSEKSQTVDSLM